METEWLGFISSIVVTFIFMGAVATLVIRYRQTGNDGFLGVIVSYAFVALCYWFISYHALMGTSAVAIRYYLRLSFGLMGFTTALFTYSNYRDDKRINTAVRRNNKRKRNQND